MILNPLIKYFFYQDKYYINGTKVTLSDEFVENFKYGNQKIWNKVMYHNSLYQNNQLLHFFTSYNYNVQKYANYVMIPDEILNMAIKNIDEPKFANIVCESNVEREIMLWSIYIFSLFFSFVFREFYLFWILNTIIFIAMKGK